MSSTSNFVIFSLIFVLHSHRIEALRILGVFPSTAPSHFIPNCMLMKGLANRGHQVDVISHFPLKKPIPNYTDISLAGATPRVGNNVTYEEALGFDHFSMREFVHLTGIMPCDLLSIDVFQQLLKTRKNTYDVIILEVLTSHCYIAFGKHLNAPIVGTVIPRVHDWLYGPFGVPLNTAYMPSLFTTWSQSMTFLERLQNTLLMKTLTPQVNYYIESEREHVENYFGRTISTMNELYDDIAILLVNSHHSIHGIMPMPPGVIEIGGLHVHDDQQELSPGIKKWLDDSKDGCVYFSFGSMVRIETFPPKTLRAFYELFENISPVRVLLKIGDETVLPSGLPKNVKTSSWFPQVAVLKHPNVKVFITHGGLIGTQEAVVHGVPMVGLPLFGDQHSNIRSYEKRGVAIALNHQEITGKSLTNAVTTILNDPSYKNNIKTLAKLFNDRPMSAMDTAIYWVEYAARHGNVLQSPATRLTWWQYHLLDVYGLVLFALLLVLYIVKQFFKLVIKLICSRKSEQANMNISKSRKVK